MSEESKAIEAVAKTAGKAIDLADKFGTFISKYISGSVEQGIGIFEDKLKYMRWERQLRLMQRAEEFMKAAGLSEPTKQIQMKYMIPLLQGATLEEDDYLQDMWAKLLVNSSTINSGIELTRNYIDILERITPLEARILEKIYSLPFEETQHKGIITVNLPEEAIIYSEKGEKDYKLENPEILLALANLSRLGCLRPALSWGGGEGFEFVNPTLMGKYFIEACALKERY